MKLKARILVYQIGSIGDTVVSIPALKTIRRNFGSDVEICLLHEIRPGRPTPADLLTGAVEIDRFIGYSWADTIGKKLISAVRLWWRLRQERFQAVVNLGPGERSSSNLKRDAFFFRLSGISRRIGFHPFSNQNLYDLDDHGLAPHEAWLRIERLRLDGLDAKLELDLTKPFLNPPVRFANEAKTWLSERRSVTKLPLVAICPGCKQPANMWPVERFIELGQRLVQQGGVELIVVGGPAELEVARRMVEVWGTGLNAAGVFPLLGAAALLSECAFVVGLDTGTTHLAAAQGVPCVALYGCREEPGRFYPLGKGHIVLRHPVPCAGCRIIESPCTTVGHPCMTGITVDEVWQAIQNIWGRIINVR
jgi:heptosyltransferase-3